MSPFMESHLFMLKCQKIEYFGSEGIHSVVKGMCLEMFRHGISEQGSEMCAAF